MKTIIFTVSAGNLGNTTTLIEIARSCQEWFEPIFISFGARYGYFIRKAGFTARFPPPIPGHPIDPDPVRLSKQITSEIAFFKKYNPVAIVNKHEMTPVISSRAAGVPLVWVLPYYWSQPCFQSGLLGDNPMNIVSHWFSNGNLPTEEQYLRPFRQAAQEFDVPVPHSFYDLLEGDHTLLTDHAQLTGVAELPPSYHYVGPIFARLNTEIPEQIQNLPQGKPIIYFAMGSSGNPGLIKAIVESFAARPQYTVIAPVQNLIQHLEVEIPENVFVTGRLPAHEVNPLADIAVIHGGQGTVHTACLSGTPIIGIGLSTEQEHNLEMVVRQGNGLRIPKETFTPEALLQAIDQMLVNKEAHQAAHRLQALYRQWDGPANAARFLVETFA